MGNNIHVYQSDITTESRVQRHCQALDESGLFDRIIYLGCTTGYERTEDFSGNCTARMLPRRNTVGRGLLFKLKATRAWGKRVFDAAVSLGADCVTCHSLPALAVCCRVKERLNCRLVYEPHELETETGVSHGLRKWIAKRTEAFYIGKCDEVITVCDSIADWYASSYPIPRPKVVKNIPCMPNNIGPIEEGLYFREKYNIPDEAVVFLYQGWIADGRRIPQYLSVFSQLDEAHQLVLMGGFSDSDLEYAVQQAAAASRNIHYHEAVPPGKLLGYTACADVGLCGVEPVCESYRLSLPNKIFEYISAGVPCLAPELPEISKVIKQTDAGWLHGDTDECLKKSILSIRPESINIHSANAIDARSLFNWDDQRSILLDSYRGVMGVLSQ